MFNVSFAVVVLAFLHFLIITLSNYLVQIPFEIHMPLSIPLFGDTLHATYGALSFPFIFLLTDLTVRLTNKFVANRVVFFAMFPALIATYVVSVLFYDGQFTGISSLLEFNTFVFRIALASFIAYVVGQILDIYVFNKLRKLKNWMVAPFTSGVVGQLIDTLIFFFVAFFRSSDEYMATYWFDMALLDYAVKFLFNLFMFLPIYGIILGFLQKFYKELFANDYSLKTT